MSGAGLLPPDSQNKGPLSGIPCAWWRYKVEERSNSRESRGWSTVDSGTSEVSFLLDDGTGQCLIDPRGAEVFPGATNVWYGPEAWPRGRIPDGTGVFGWLVDHVLTDKFRYTEHRLELGKHVQAIGAFRSLGGASVQDPDVAVTGTPNDWKQTDHAALPRASTPTMTER